MIACPFDDILIICCLTSIFYWCANKIRKLRGKPPIVRRCKHKEHSDDDRD